MYLCSVKDFSFVEICGREIDYLFTEPQGAKKGLLNCIIEDKMEKKLFSMSSSVILGKSIIAIDCLF